MHACVHTNTHEAECGHHEDRALQVHALSTPCASGGNHENRFSGVKRERNTQEFCAGKDKFFASRWAGSMMKKLWLCLAAQETRSGAVAGNRGLMQNTRCMRGEGNRQLSGTTHPLDAPALMGEDKCASLEKRGKRCCVDEGVTGCSCQEQIVFG